MRDIISPLCLLTVDEACKIIGLGKTRLYQELKSGRLKAVKSGKRTLIPQTAIQEWLLSLPGYSTTKN